MGWFTRRNRDDHGDAAAHVEPVVIDLGLQKEFEAEMEVERLKSAGLAVFLVAQDERAHGGGGLNPKHCRVYVQPGDEAQVRAELEASGFL